jgi:hypothetical protein
MHFGPEEVADKTCEVAMRQLFFEVAGYGKQQILIVSFWTIPKALRALHLLLKLMHSVEI